MSLGQVDIRRDDHRIAGEGLERAGADLFALFSDVESKHELNGNSHGDYYERNRAVIRRFGMDDLFELRELGAEFQRAN